MLTRRNVLAPLAAGAAVIAGGATLALRLHHTPSRTPFLTDVHLGQIAMPKQGPPRVLFVGNSMTLHHDIPGRVAAVAAAEGYDIRVATAAATGAWLIESMRLDALEEIMRPTLWEAIVLQDFSKASLNQINRIGSIRAMKTLVKWVSPTPVVLFPPWPASADNKVYQDAGRLAFTPESPTDYASTTMAHYTQVARQTGSTVAQIPEQWLMHDVAGASLYATDGHHSNPEGADFVAQVLWHSLRQVL